MRGFALSRMNRGCRRTQLGSWIPGKCPVPLSTDLSCSACALKLRSLPQILSSGWWRWRWQTPNFGRRVECDFALFFTLVGTFGHFPRDSAATKLLFQGFFVGSECKFWSIRATLMRIRTLSYILGWTLSFPNSYVAQRTLWEFHAALYPGICNLIGWNSSTRPQNLYTVNLFVHKDALLSEFASRLHFVMLTFGRMPSKHTTDS